MRFITSAYVVPTAPLPAGIPVGYGDGTQEDGNPGPWAFLSGIYETDYTTSTATTTVTNQTELDAAITSATSGDVIRIADGDYTDLIVTDKSYVSEVIFEAASYQGAVFSGNVIATNSDNVTFRGMKASTIQHVACNNVAIHYTFCRTMLSMQGDQDSTVYSGLEWYGCIADRAWPSPADKGVAGFIRQMNGGYSGTLVDGPQQGCVKKCIFMRSTEDCFKHTWASDLMYSQCVFWGSRATDAEKTANDIHGDPFQSSGVGATGSQIPADVTLHQCAFINLWQSGYSSGQGPWMKDGVHLRWRLHGCFLTSRTNSTTMSFANIHTDSVLYKCMSNHHIRMSGGSNTIDGSIFGVNVIESGASSPVVTNSLTFGYNGPETVYTSIRNTIAPVPENFLLSDQTQYETYGDREALELIHNRMVAGGLTGFIPTGWLA